MLQLAFHPDVKLEIADAFKWYQQQAKGLGDAYISELELAFQQLLKCRILGQSSKKTLGVIFFPDFLSRSYTNRVPTLFRCRCHAPKQKTQLLDGAAIEDVGLRTKGVLIRPTDKIPLLKGAGGIYILFPILIFSRTQAPAWE